MANRFGGYEFQEFIAEFYDVTYANLRNKDIDFFIDYSKRAKGRTLELGCGTGRVLIPTAISGCQITGLDISSHMLRRCQEKLEQQPGKVQERVRLIQGNMTDFETGEMYPLVTIPFRPFIHLISVEEQKSCLDCVNRHLLPHGLLILDLFHCFPPRMYDPKYTTEEEDLHDLKLPDGRCLRRTSRTSAFHRDKQYNDVEMIYYVSHPDGRIERLVQSFPYRYFFRYEVEHLLDLCGFRVIELFGDFDGSKLSDDSPEMIFVAEKK
jgi:SAM-dependent methyltransferase